MAIHSRLSRLLCLLRLVAAGRRNNVAQLAELLGVSRRTIFRDIDILRQAEVPIYYDEAIGAYGLHPDPLTSSIRHVRSEEMTMLLTAAHFSPLRLFSGMQDAVDNAIAAIIAISKDSTRIETGNILACCAHPYRDDGAEDMDDVDTKAILLDAVKQGRQVRVSLADRLPEDQWHTKIVPYRILIDRNDWILVGRSSYDRETCQFRIANIRRIELTDDPFIVPQNFTHLERRTRYDSQEILVSEHSMR